ncbi:hypothetical protein Hamer_G015436, partial [Homarus americanus]
ELLQSRRRDWCVIIQRDINARLNVGNEAVKVFEDGVVVGSAVTRLQKGWTTTFMGLCNGLC